VSTCKRHIPLDSINNTNFFLLHTPQGRHAPHTQLTTKSAAKITIEEKLAAASAARELKQQNAGGAAAARRSSSNRSITCATQRGPCGAARMAQG
jgi:hypothetical protein